MDIKPGEITDILKREIKEYGREIDVAVQWEIDVSLLGGVVATMGDLVFDGSLRTQLRQLRASLTKEG